MFGGRLAFLGNTDIQFPLEPRRLRRLEAPPLAGVLTRAQDVKNFYIPALTAELCDLEDPTTIFVDVLALWLAGPFVHRLKDRSGFGGLVFNAKRTGKRSGKTMGKGEFSHSLGFGIFPNRSKKRFGAYRCRCESHPAFGRTDLGLCKSLGPRLTHTPGA